MKFFNKINQYILERFPVLWNTHFIWVMAFGVFLHLLYFVIGYALLDISLLKTYSIGSAFFNNVFFWIYLIVCLIVLIFMSFRFYAHNPFKNYYPLPFLYFWKVFGLLFLSVLLYITVFISFETGMQLKSKHLIPEDRFLNEVKAINKAYPFLFNDINDYHILHRSYPKPFPVEDIGDFDMGWDSVKEIQQKHGIDKTQPYVTLGGMPFQFGYTKVVKPDSCSSMEVIDRIVDVSSVYGLSLYSFYNFGRSYIDYPAFPYTETFRSFDPAALRVAREDSAAQQLYPEIHAIYRNRDAAAITATLSELVRICDQYGVAHQLKPSKMTEAILAQDLNTEQLVRTGFYDHTQQEKPMIAATINSEYNDDERNDRKQNMEDNYSVDLDDLKHMADNKTNLQYSMGSNFLSKDSTWAFVFVSMLIAFVLLILKYVKTKTVLVGSVVAGIIASLFAVLFFFTESTIRYSHYEHKDDYYWILSMVIVALVFCVGVATILLPQCKKRIAEFGFVPTLISTILLPILLLVGAMLWSRYAVKDPCSDRMDTMYHIDLHPFYFFLLALVSIQLIFMLMRKLHAKME